MNKFVDRYGRTGVAAITSIVWLLPFAAWAGAADLSPIDRSATPTIAFTIGVVMLALWLVLVASLGRFQVTPRQRRFDIGQMSPSEKRWTLGVFAFALGLVAWLNAAATVDWGILSSAIGAGEIGPILLAIALAIFVIVVLGLVMRLAGISIFKFLAYMREELTIVLATASSDAVLPQIMRKLERMGAKKSVVGLVVPTGYSFNLDAFSIYLTLAVVFIAQATNTPLSLGDLLLVLGVSLVTSKGAHGVPGSAIVILAATLNAVPSIPAIGLVLVLSVDWFIGMARALGNLIGNCVATVVIAAWEGDLDRETAARVLDGKEVVDVTAG